MAESGPSRCRRPVVLASSSPSDPFTGTHVARDFPSHGAMIGLTAQRHGLQRTNDDDVAESGKQRARGKEHAHLDACVTAVRSDSHRWRSRGGAFIPVLRPRDREFRRESIPSVRFSRLSVRLRVSAARSVRRVSRVGIRVSRRMMYVMCGRGALVRSAHDCDLPPVLAIAP